MKARWLSLVVGVLAASVWLAGAAGGDEPADPTKLPQGTFQVIPLGAKSALLVDTRTGQTWTLQTDPEEDPAQVWVPARKLSTNMEIDQWRQRAKKAKEARRKRREGIDGPLPELPELGLPVDPAATVRRTPWSLEPTPYEWRERAKNLLPR